MVQTAFGLRPWWAHGKQGLPSTVAFTTKRSVASSKLYDTLPALDWSSLSLLERSQYLLLVFLAAVQIHNGRVPTELPAPGLPPGPANRSSLRAMENMTTYLSGLKAAIAGQFFTMIQRLYKAKYHLIASTEVGEFNPTLEDRLSSENVRQAINRWESESVIPGVSQSKCRLEALWPAFSDSVPPARHSPRG